MSEGVKRKGSDDSSTLTKKKQIARQRWQILSRTLRGQSTSETQQSSVSVRRFNTFGLLQTEKVESREDSSQEAAAWFSYTCSSIPDFLINVRHVSQTLRPEDLLGFNNTGNVCVWPAEEVMTYYCLQHALDFRDCSILELGGGMTCLAGIAVAAFSGAKHVVVSDGNQQSVDNLHKIIEENNFGETTVNARLLRWGPEPLDHDLQESFDWVLCADCLFFEGREHLANIIFSALKPGGHALVFAPGRSGTFDLFCDVAEKQFAHISRRGAHYDRHIQALHSELQGSSDSYSEDLHLPLLVELTKAHGHAASSRDTTPESR